MKFLQLFEGVRKEGDKYVFDFSKDTPEDIMDLKFQKGRRKKVTRGGVPYEYYFAFDYDNNQDKDFLYALKKGDTDKIDPAAVEALLNKAVLGFDERFKLNTFDTIIYPKSSSDVLHELAVKVSKKAGQNTVVLPDAFVKATRDQIDFDFDKIDKLPEKTKKQVYATIQRIKRDEGEFKMKTVFNAFRKFVTNFIVLGDADRRTINSITDKRVILIDDYKTSGTTLKAMMDKLITLRPELIVVLVLIRLQKDT